MVAPLFSSSWYRVAKLKPRLRNQARFVRHTYRGERWYVMQDLASGRFLRFDPAAYRVATLMDGMRTLEDIWQNVCVTMGGEAPTQDEVLNLLSQLHHANVLVTDQKPDIQELDQRRQKIKSMKLRQYLSNPLSLKLPLFDPDRLLTYLAGRVSPVAIKWLLWLWAAVVVSGLAMAVFNWGELTEDMTSRVFTPENMLILWLVFPLLKAAHELGHGLAIKAFGGSCHEMGLMFLVLVPIPYVDASQAVAMQDKRKRIVVGLAGMMAELFIAAIAVWLWSGASPGVFKAFMHQTILLAGLTTLVFNANPLIRYDGYYVLADWLEIPNLGKKANQYVGYLVNRYAFGVREGLSAPHLTPREPAWLVLYAILSFIYRTLLSVAIILMVAGEFFFVGIVLACWAAYSMLILPILHQVRFLSSDALLEGRRKRALLISGGLTAVILLFVFFVPRPAWTNAEGVIWMPDESQVRAPLACFGGRVLVQPGEMVRAGDKLLTCVEPELDAQYTQMEARIHELEARMTWANADDRVQAQIINAELQHFRKKLADLERRRGEMSMSSPHDGKFVMPAPGDFAGRYMERGDVVAYVLDPARFSLITVVPQGDADLVRNRTTRVELRSVDRVWDLLPARITREVPAASNDLPSMALSLQGGGNIGLDPNARQDDVPKALVSLFQFEVKLTGESLPKVLGSRVYVRFVHDPEPIAVQWYRTLRQMFIKRFAT